MKQEEALHIVLPAADSLIVSRPDDLYMTIYNPDERLLGLLKKLVSAEGLFVWKPKRQLNLDGRFIGVDGCKGGWIAAVIEKEKLSVQKVATIAELVNEYPNFDAFLIDMPIGPPESKEDNKK